MSGKQPTKVYELNIVALNTRTGQREKLNVSCNGHGGLTASGLEHVMTFGARLYARGWDHIEFSIETVTKKERRPTHVVYRRA